MQRSTALMLLWAVPVVAEDLDLFNPKLCFLLDGFLGLYGLFITGMFLREKFFRPKAQTDGIYSSLRGQDPGYDELHFGGRRQRGARGPDDSEYMGLRPRGEDSEYRELPRREAGREQRQRKNEQVYQGLSAATRDTYDVLQQH